jgi:Mycothiol maleylpyruvate isomerase N-terminal domain
MPNSFSEPNRTAFVELRTYAEGLPAEQLTQSIDDDWTVSSVLAHVAFWDRRTVVCVDGMLRDSSYLPLRTEVDVINPAMLPQWRRLEPNSSLEEFIEAGELFLRTVDSLDEETAQRIQSSGVVNVRRWRHYQEHLEQIRHHFA